MNKRIVLFISILLSALLAACGQASTPAATGSGAALDGQTLMQQRCSVCHSLDRITSAHKTADQWKATVERMVNHGAKLDAGE